MESPNAKRYKFHKESVAATTNKNLMTICDWSKSKAIAIKHHEDALTSMEVTYAELAAAKHGVAQILRDTSISLFIGITFDIPSYCLPALMLGIVSRDHAFVCLPASSLEAQRICDKLRISHIFSSENISKFSVILDFQIHCKRLFLLQTKDLCSDPIESASKEQTFAYAITTSGSSGDPKIVRVTHRSIVPNILDLKRILVVSENDTIAQITPVTFDPSIIEIFLSLSCSGTLFTASQEMKHDPKTLLKSIVDSRVSVLQSTPSVLLHRWSSEELRQTILGKNSNLRILILGGENLPSPKVLKRMKAPENRTRIFDIYGITEVSCWATIRDILPHDCTRILGESLSETILEVRDEEGNIVKEGEGILHIGTNSRICAIDDEEIAQLNAPVFRDTGDLVAIDEKGFMTLKGRKGRKVKRYGIKLNLTELESHVLQLPFVENCYALFMENNQSLHLFFTTFDKSSNENEKLGYETDVLGHTIKLSNIFRPDNVYLLNQFELTPNGKICRRFLRKLTAKLTNASRSAKKDGDIKTEEIFANIWKRLLPSSGDSKFLDSGGNSVMALRITNELAEKSGHDFPELIGRLLRNENSKTCQTYISRETLNFSNTIVKETNTKELTIRRSSESNVDDRFSRNNETPAVDTSNNLIKADINVAWQKCRGRSSFPAEIEAEKLNEWTNVSEIRLQQLYSLGKCVDASPTIFAYSGGKNYVTVGSHSGVICTAELSKENCPDYWKITLPDRIEASVLVLNDFKAVVGSYDGHVYCLHLKTGEIFWKFKTGDAVKCTAVISSQRRNIFFGSYDHYVYCVSLENGSEVWKTKGGGSISATPCIHSDFNSVLFAMLDGTCVSLKQDSGEILWRNKLDYPIFSAPVILENNVAVFCDVSGELSGFSLSTGEKRWSVKINGTVFSHLSVNIDPTTRLRSLLFASQNRNIYKFDCSSRKEAPTVQLEKDLGVPVFSTPWSNGKVIVAVGTDGELKLLDFVTGKLLNTFKLGGDAFSSPIIHEDFIVVGCRDNNLYILTCSKVNAR